MLKYLRNLYIRDDLKKSQKQLCLLTVRYAENNLENEKFFKKTLKYDHQN